MYKFRNNTLSHCKKAFSLVEIMTGIGLLGLIIITICGVFVHGLEAIKKGRYKGGAIHIANQKFDEVKEADWGDPSGVPTAGLSDAPPAGYIEGFDFCIDPGYGSCIGWKKTDYMGEYRISGLQNMSGIDYGFDIYIDCYGDNIKKVTVKVTWQEIGGEKTLELCTLIPRRE